MDCAERVQAGFDGADRAWRGVVELLVGRSCLLVVIPVDSILAFVYRPLAVAAAIRVVVAQCGADVEALDVHEVDLGWGGRAHEVRDDGLTLPPRLAFEGIAPLDQVTEQVEDLAGDVNVAGVEQVVERPLELVMGYRALLFFFLKV